MNRYTFKIYDKKLKEFNINSLEDFAEDDYWYDGETTVWNVLYDCTHEQERFVAMQCTGLKDVDGNYIFENDIVEINDKFDGIFQTNVVFKNGCFGIDMSIVKQIKNPNGWDKIYDKCKSLGMNLSKYKTLTKANDDMVSGYGYHTDNCKIIGNKFDKEED